MSRLNLEPLEEFGIKNKILSVSKPLFDSVKLAQPSFRDNFPSILRKNSFALSVLVTKNYAFLEVTSKLKAKPSNDTKRLLKYNHLFVPFESNEKAVFSVDKSRFCRFSRLTLEGSAGFQVGEDVSLCLWDLRHSFVKGGRTIFNEIDLLYVVGFGKKIRPEESWMEFDSLIRLTLSDWGEF